MNSDLAHQLAALEAQLRKMQKEEEEKKGGKGKPQNGGDEGYLSETAEIIKGLSAKIDQLLQVKSLDPQSRQSLENIKNMLKDANASEEVLRKDIKALPNKKVGEMLEKYFESNKTEQQEQKKTQKSQWDEPGQNGQGSNDSRMDYIKNNLKICSMPNDNKIIAVKPLELPALNYSSWSYAKAC